MSFFNRISSKNAVKTTVSVLQEVMSEVVSNCETRMTNSNVINIGSGSTLFGNRIYQKINVEVNAECFHDSFLSVTQQQTLKSKLEQAARASLTGFHVGSVAETENVISQYIEEVMRISNTSILNCVVDLTNQNVIEISEKALVIGNSFYQEIAATLVQSCVQKQLQESKQVQNLQFLIDQSASATGDNVMALWIVLGIVVMIFLCFNTPTIQLYRPLIMTVIAILVVISIYFLFYIPQSYYVTILNTTPKEDHVFYFDRESETMTLEKAQQICASTPSYYGFYFYHNSKNKKEDQGKVQWKTFKDILFPSEKFKTLSGKDTSWITEDIPIFIHSRKPNREIDRGMNGSLFLQLVSKDDEIKGEIKGEKENKSAFTKIVIWILQSSMWYEMTSLVLPNSIQTESSIFISKTHDEFMTKNYPPKGHNLWFDISQYPMLVFYQPNSNQDGWNVLYTTNIQPYQSCGFQWKGNSVSEKGCSLYIGTKSRYYFIQCIFILLLTIVVILYFYSQYISRFHSKNLKEKKKENLLFK
uniref:Uncharacterized protein n=1 Tax=viral metagenome TaxID=1070528 RepID=A0A6C0D1B8_9ZZZZ